jgi:DNA-directed RNA polymerase subunit RPC12/RpoP
MRIRYMLILVLAMATLLWWLSLYMAAQFRRDRTNRCPSCSSARIRRSWPTFHDKILTLSAITPLRCEACQKRFYVPTSRVISSARMG